jgi:hypothetical protein
MDNLTIYNAARSVPQAAQKEIKGGRLKGMTSITPQWRLEKLTELFGVCGFGWYTEITKQELIPCDDKEVMTFVNINLYVKINDEWSRPIIGVGGHKLAMAEKTGLYYSDECWKMAYTDALSVACKALGIGADVYMGAPDDKYTRFNNDAPDAPRPPQNSAPMYNAQNPPPTRPRGGAPQQTGETGAW